MHRGNKNLVTVLNKRNLVFYSFSNYNRALNVITMPYEADIVAI